MSLSSCTPQANREFFGRGVTALTCCRVVAEDAKSRSSSRVSHAHSRPMILGHRKLALWYDQLAQQLEAGLPLADALRLSGGNGAPATTLNAMRLAIEHGGTVDDALRCAGSWLPFTDRLALTAAASAGRMPRTLHTLATRHAQIGAAKLRIVLACAYPLGILHFGLLLLPVARIIDWEQGLPLERGGLCAWDRADDSPALDRRPRIWILAHLSPALLGAASRFVPAIRNYVRSQELADFSFALGNLLEAGIPIGQAWAAVGAITSSPELKAAAVSVETMIARGEAPGKKLARGPAFRLILSRCIERESRPDNSTPICCGSPQLIRTPPTARSPSPPCSTRR